jgi:lipid-A-disaccharide synthase
MIVCGEASGDMYAGALTSALRELDPAVVVCGVGGSRFREAGGELLADYRGISVTGLSEALAVLPRSWRLLRMLEREARARRPHVFVALDFPDFNFRLLPVMQRLGIPVVYYVSPQVWAWRAGRLETIRKFVARMLVIFPFERAMYEKAGVPVEFVGHPLVDLVPQANGASGSAAHGIDSTDAVVALLPGSRPNEVRRHLSILVDAACLIHARHPRVEFLVARAPSLDAHLFAPIERLERAGARATILEHATDDVLNAASVVITAAGTATVQTAIHGKPMVVMYRVSRLTYLLARRFVRVSTFGMVNLVAGRHLVPELIQDQCTPERIADETLSLLADHAKAEAVRQGLAEVRLALGGPGASARAAAAVMAVAHAGASRG